MKVLFAVSNESISNSIVKKYQKEYKEIISYKNVYYFNAILKELQKDKSYDRIVISEELEQFTNSDYEQMDKFIFERLDGISDEATNGSGADIPILLICSERRTPGESILVKLFGIGIYNAIMGRDRSIDEVCKLINRPRAKKDAKIYYRIESEDVNYQAENENDVSEVEVQNILAHYKRLGKNEERYVESFNNIASQYNDVQLRLISKYLPLNVRAVLEEQSPKYQQIMSFNNSVSNSVRYGEKTSKETQRVTGTSEKLLGNASENKLAGRVIIPQNIKKDGGKKLTTRTPINEQNNIQNTIETNNTRVTSEIKPNIENTNRTSMQKNILEESSSENSIEDIYNRIVSEPVKHFNRPQEEIKEPSYGEDFNENIEVTDIVEEPKRKRGRPKKIVSEEQLAQENLVQDGVKKKRGRPRKNPLPEAEENYEAILPGFEEEDNQKTSNILSGFGEEESVKQETSSILPGFGEEEPIKQETSSILPGFGEEEPIKQETSSALPGFGEEETAKQEQSNILPGFGYEPQNYNSNSYFGQSNRKIEYDQVNEEIDLNNLLSEGRKIVAFVGASKNGTSFIVNNLAEKLSSMGVDTAILDATQNKNSYYIYTKNEENLRRTAASSVLNLKNGISNGIRANKNLTIYTSVPNDEEASLVPESPILETLLKHHKIVLIDCDFATPKGFFKNASEIYLVQSMDILTIQPLTAFLDELKAKKVLDETKLRIILNKYVRLRGVNEKTIIGGMAYYNNPEMSIMEELFDRNIVKYMVIPFELDTYIKYLEGIVECDVSIKGYSKTFKQMLDHLAGMVYPTNRGKEKYVPNSTAYENGFSSSMNDTLNKMKQKY